MIKPYPYWKVLATFLFLGGLPGSFLYLVTIYIRECVFLKMCSVEQGFSFLSLLGSGALIGTPSALITGMAACIGKWRRVRGDYVKCAVAGLLASLPLSLILLAEGMQLDTRFILMVILLPLCGMVSALLLGRLCFPTADISDGLLPESRKNQNEP